MHRALFVFLHSRVCSTSTWKLSNGRVEYKPTGVSQGGHLQGCAAPSSQQEFHTTLGTEPLSPRTFSALIFPLLMPRNLLSFHTLSKVQPLPRLDSTLGFSRYSGKENHSYLLTASSADTNFGSFFMIQKC